MVSVRTYDQIEKITIKEQCLWQRYGKTDFSVLSCTKQTEQPLTKKVFVFMLTADLQLSLSPMSMPLTTWIKLLYNYVQSMTTVIGPYLQMFQMLHLVIEYFRT